MSQRFPSSVAGRSAERVGEGVLTPPHYSASRGDPRGQGRYGSPLDFKGAATTDQARPLRSNPGRRC